MLGMTQKLLLLAPSPLWGEGRVRGSENTEVFLSHSFVDSFRSQFELLRWRFESRHQT